MSVFLILAFLFCIGAAGGWGIEVIFRRFFSANNPERRWINPGFLTGPYLPLYGTGLVLLYLIAQLEPHIHVGSALGAKLILFAVMAVIMTVIEYLAGVLSIDIFHVRLWDYSGCWGNFRGIICPLFSFFWAMLGAMYYFLVHPYLLDALAWLSKNLAFSFFIGMFYGVFIIDLVHSTKAMVMIRTFAREKQIVVRYDDLKARVRSRAEAQLLKARFLFDMRSDLSLKELLADYAEHLDEMKRHFEERLPKNAGRS